MTTDCSTCGHLEMIEIDGTITTHCSVVKCPKDILDDCAKYIEEYGRGKCVSDDAAKALADEIRKLLSGGGVT